MILDLTKAEETNHSRKESRPKKIDTIIVNSYVRIPLRQSYCQIVYVMSRR